MADTRTVPPSRPILLEPAWDRPPRRGTTPSPRKGGGSRWMIPSYIPWINWMTWIYVAAQTRYKPYYGFGALYLVPFIIVAAVSAASNGPDANLPDWLTMLGGVSWIGGLVHVFMMKKEIEQRLEDAAAAGRVPVNLWPPAWRVWSYIPGLHWVTWLHAALRTGYVPYCALAAIYALPLCFCVAFSKPTNDGHTDAPTWTGVLLLISWVICIIHATVLTRDVNERVRGASRRAANERDEETPIELDSSPAQAPVIVCPPSVRPAQTEPTSQPKTTSGFSVILWSLVPTREKITTRLREKLENQAIDWIWEAAKWAGGFALSFVMLWIKNKAWQ